MGRNGWYDSRVSALKARAMCPMSFSNRQCRQILRYVHSTEGEIQNQSAGLLRNVELPWGVCAINQNFGTQLDEGENTGDEKMCVQKML